MSGASISCSHEMRTWLKSYMDVHKLDSYDAALRHLRDKLGGQGQAFGEKEPEPALSPVQKKQKAKQKKKQLVTWDDFNGSSEVMTYLTGLSEKARDWLISRLQEKVTRERKNRHLW